MVLKGNKVSEIIIALLSVLGIDRFLSSLPLFYYYILNINVFSSSYLLIFGIIDIILFIILLLFVYFMVDLGKIYRKWLIIGFILILVSKFLIILMPIIVSFK